MTSFSWQLGREKPSTTGMELVSLRCSSVGTKKLLPQKEKLVTEK
jgi:hypothetical protein